MYVINTFAYGLDVFANEEIQSIVDELGMTDDFETPSGFVRGDYHGGAFHVPCFVGIEVKSDDDDMDISKSKKDYLSAIRNAQKEDYYDRYVELREQWLKEMNDALEASKKEHSQEDWYEEVTANIKKFMEWVASTEPDFYTFESSS